jgi:hypothetical protein
MKTNELPSLFGWIYCKVGIAWTTSIADLKPSVIRGELIEEETPPNVSKPC